jgi:hypothetical protein
VLIQYFGYLRRNPNDQPDTDYAGFDFWLTKLKKAVQKFFRKLLKGLRYIPRVLQTS